MKFCLLKNEVAFVIAVCGSSSFYLYLQDIRYGGLRKSVDLGKLHVVSLHFLKDLWLSHFCVPHFWLNCISWSWFVNWIHVIYSHVHHVNSIISVRVCCHCFRLGTDSAHFTPLNFNWGDPVWLTGRIKNIQKLTTTCAWSFQYQAPVVYVDMVCCVVLQYVVLCYTMLCCIMLCCIMLCWVILCCVV